MDVGDGWGFGSSSGPCFHPPKGDGASRRTFSFLTLPCQGPNDRSFESHISGRRPTLEAALTVEAGPQDPFLLHDVGREGGRIGYNGLAGAATFQLLCIFVPPSLFLIPTLPGTT